MSAPRTYSSLNYQYSPECTDEESWDACMDAVRKHDHEMCKNWVKNLDALLVFSGLFTAVVTAFTVDSYHWLLPDKSDLMVQVLQQISQQLSNASSIVEAPQLSRAGFTPSNAAIRINAFWFLSITLSLSSALIIILCKQWVQEYARDPALSSKEGLEFRQMRFQGLEKWKLPAMLSMTSVLVQAALLLFFAGILDMLWQFEYASSIAVSVSVALGFVLGSVFFTTLVSTIYLALGISSLPKHQQEPVEVPHPSRQPSTKESLLKTLEFFPYKNATVLYESLAFASQALLGLFPRRVALSLPGRPSWRTVERGLQQTQTQVEESLLKALTWVYEEMEHDTTMTNHILHCIASIHIHEYQETDRDLLLELFAKVCKTEYLYQHNGARMSQRFRIELIAGAFSDIAEKVTQPPYDLQWAERVVKTLLPVLHFNIISKLPDLELTRAEEEHRTFRDQVSPALQAVLRQGLVPPNSESMDHIWKIVWPSSLPPGECPDAEALAKCCVAVPDWLEARKAPGFLDRSAGIELVVQSLLKRFKSREPSTSVRESPVFAEAMRVIANELNAGNNNTAASRTERTTTEELEELTRFVGTTIGLALDPSEGRVTAIASSGDFDTVARPVSHQA